MYMRDVKIVDLNLVLRILKYEPLSTSNISCGIKASEDDVVVVICKRDVTEVE